MPVGEMLRRTSSAELTEWAAYEQITGPLGPERTDILIAQLCAVVANANRDKKSKRAKPKDFLPKWDRGRGEPQTWQQTKSVARMLNAAFGGTVNGHPVGQDKPAKAKTQAKPATDTTPAPSRPGRYQTRTRDGLAVVLDTRTGHVEWTGLDTAQADAIAAGLNTTN